MPVDARRPVRKMRGGAQAHLIEAADGHFYVVKFINNPQHRRVLVNDWIGACFLRYLGVATPEPAIVRLSQDFIAEYQSEVNIQLGSKQVLPEAGWHFGSRFPGDPLRTVVYDYLPDALLEKTENIADFAGALAFDQWTGNADSRQAIFFRARLREWPSAAGAGRFSKGEPDAAEARQGFVAQMIDHGFLFEGPHWRFGDSPLRGLYHRPMVYEDVTRLADFDPWLERIVHFPEEVIDQALKQIPSAWLAKETGLEGGTEFEGATGRDALENLMEQLLRRRKRVPDLIEACRAARSNVFPNWR